MAFTKEERVEQLKACAEGIISNAEDIIAHADMDVDWEVTITMKLKEMPTVKVERSFIPKELLTVLDKYHS